MPLDDDALREAASHRGLKLVKSRKRKPGVGDYGKFGLLDAGGKALFGVGDAGLIASAAEIAGYLREGETSSWTASATATPDKAPSKPPSRTPVELEEDVPPAIAPRRRRAAPASPAKPRRLDRKDSPPKEGKTAAKAERPSKPPPEAHAGPPPLAIRSATKSDAPRIASLLDDPSLSAVGIRKRIGQAYRLSEPLIVATRGDMIGLLEWHLVPGLTGDIVRITTIFVTPDERKRGIGRKLMEAVMAQAAERGLPIEAMSDIAVRNIHGFFRTMGFEHVSYRFIRTPSD